MCRAIACVDGRVYQRDVDEVEHITPSSDKLDRTYTD